MSSLSMIKMQPFYSLRPWGYELWTLSTHPHGQSLVLPQKEPLKAYLGHSLPILIKIIKADESLSVQVHPNDDYAWTHEHDQGKSECWYILEAKPDAQLIIGLKEGLDRTKLNQMIEDEHLELALQTISIQAGDMIYIPSGTVHAILGGIKLFEVQQSSDSTYRLYDWGRKREMHIQKALDVIDYANKNGAGKVENFTILETPFFRIEKIQLSQEAKTYTVVEDFQTLNTCHGKGIVKTKDQTLSLIPEETIYIPHGVTYTIEGDPNVELLRTW